MRDCLSTDMVAANLIATIEKKPEANWNPILPAVPEISPLLTLSLKQANWLKMIILHWSRFGFEPDNWINAEDYSSGNWGGSTPKEEITKHALECATAADPRRNGLPSLAVQ